MADVIDPKKKFNHRWKTDPRYIKGFDYDSPAFADVPDDLKWAIPLSEHQETSEFKALQKESDARLKQRLENERAELKRATMTRLRTLSVVR